jgi:hypothetical protein
MARKLLIVFAVVLAIFAAPPNLGHAQGRGGGFHGGGFHGGFGSEAAALVSEVAASVFGGAALVSGAPALAGVPAGAGAGAGRSAGGVGVPVGVGAVAGFGPRDGAGSGASATLRLALPA